MIFSDCIVHKSPSKPAVYLLTKLLETTGFVMSIMVCIECSFSHKLNVSKSIFTILTLFTNYKYKSVCSIRNYRKRERERIDTNDCYG